MTPITHHMIYHDSRRPITMPQHPQLFANQWTICTHITAIPLMMLCRSSKVSNYQLTDLWYVHYSPSYRHCHGSLATPLTASPTSHFHNIRCPGRLWYIDSKEQRHNMWVRHRVCKHFACWFYLTSSVLFFRRFMAPTITPTSHPIHHPVVLKSHCKKI